MKRSLAFFLSTALLTLSSPAATPDPDPAAAVPAVEKSAAEPSLREQSIYVPYGKLWQVFEKEGRGVFLPYEEFRKLWEAASIATPKPPADQPAADALIAECRGTAVVSADVVQFKAEIQMELLKQGWQEVPVGLGDVAIMKAVLGDAPARLVKRAEGYAVLVERKGRDATPLVLKVEFAKAFTKSSGRNSVTFQSPLAPVSRWDIRIPEPGVQVDIQPALAVTRTPESATNTETRILAFVGATSAVTLEWTPRAEGAKGLQALATAQAEHQVRIEEGVTKCRVNLQYEIRRAELSELSLEVPADVKVTSVFDQNVREWAVTESNGVQSIRVKLFEPARSRQTLLVEMELFSTDPEVPAPGLRALGVIRQQGILVVSAAAGLKVEPAVREGLVQLDAADLPKSLSAIAWVCSYRYAATPFRLSLRVEKVQPAVVAESFLAVHLQPDAMDLNLTSIQDVRKAGIFLMEFDIPADYELRDVLSLQVADARPVQIDRHHVSETQPAGAWKRLQVTLARQAQGKCCLTLNLRKTLDVPELLTPLGRAALIPVPAPRVRTAGLEQETGRIVVYGAQSIRINPAEPKGLRSIPYQEARTGFPESIPATERAALSYAYGTEPVSLGLSAERRAPQVTVRQALVSRVESGVVRYSASFFYDILYSGVKTLRIDVPTDKLARLRLTPQELRYITLDETRKPAKLLPGYTALQIEGESEFIGSPSLQLSWEEKIDNLNVGATVPLNIPRLIPRDVDRAWGQVVLAKAEGIDLVPEEARTGLRAIDPAHDLMPGLQLADGAAAFEFHEDWNLRVRATRYETAEIKATSIERSLVRMVLTRGATTGVQALFRVKSTRQRLAVELPASVSFDTDPLRINGRPASLERGEQGRYQIPLIGQEPDRPFLLELRYVLTGNATTLPLPVFPEDPAMQQVYLSVYLPEDRVYLGALGPWNTEMVWVLRGFDSWPRGNKNDPQLLQWVAEGVQSDPSTFSGFATQGRHLLFSALRPEPDAKNQLRLVTLRRWMFQTVLLALIAGLGLALLNRPARTRLLAGGAALVAVTMLAVYAPSAARATVNNATAAAVFLVFVVWGLRFLLITLPQSEFWKSRSRRTVEDTATPTGPEDSTENSNPANPQPPQDA